MNGPIPKSMMRVLAGCLLLAVALLMCVGCSGINASKSVSPLDFILPGLMRNTPPLPTVPSGTALVCRHFVPEQPLISQL